MTAHWQRRPIRTLLRVFVSLGALAIGGKIYLSVLPHSPALGAFAVIGTGAVLAMTFLDVDHEVDESTAREDSETIA